MELAAAVVAGTGATRVAVLVDETPSAAEKRARAIGADVLQLHGEEDPRTVEEIRQRGAWRIWKSVRARSVQDVERAVDRYLDLVDGILVEGWREGVIGGGGARLAVEPGPVREAVPDGTDLVLAGGLTPGNVAESVALFRPDVVDVSSGVEKRLREKDPELVADFIDAARLASPLRQHATDASSEGRDE